MASERIALLLQGGGALGSYQAGTFEALDKVGLCPHWIAGISIGAINAVLIAGNPPGKAVERLHDFWSLVASGGSPFPTFDEWMARAWNSVALTSAVSFGVPGFFKPRLVPPFAQPAGSPAALSFYDTSDLKGTLERLVDFDRVNSGAIRVSLGAVDITSGNFAYFDTAKTRIGPEHVMASGALPPGLPPIEIDGRYYWDGGLVSNTPLQYVIDHDGQDSILAFQVDLFSARGPMPKTLLEAAEREKDIRYSSRTRLNTDVLKYRQTMGAAAQRLADRLPDSLKHDPDLALLMKQADVPAMTIVHLIYKAKHEDTFSKDYDFSRTAIEAHWAAGRADVETAMAHPDWRHRKPPTPGTIQIFDLRGNVPTG